MTVYGSGFTGDMEVAWNGQTRPTQFVNDFVLKASLSPTDLAAPGLGRVSVLSGGTRISDEACVLVYLPIAHNDLLYDAQRQRIYIAVSEQDTHGPALAILDPVAGLVERYIPLPAEPHLLGLAKNSSLLYVALADRIRRIDLAQGSSDLDIPLDSLVAGLPPGPNSTGAWKVRSIVPLASTPGSFAVGMIQLGGPGYTVAVIVDGNTPRRDPWINSAPCLMTFDEVTFYASAPLFRNTIGPGGFSATPSSSLAPLSGVSCAVATQGLIYSGDGKVATAAATPIVLDTLNASGLVAPAPEHGVIYYLSGDGTAANIQSLVVFDAQQRNLLKTILLPLTKYKANGRGGEGRLVHWGEDGVAFGDYSSPTSEVAKWLYVAQIP